MGVSNLDYVRRLVPEPAVLCGVRLRPLSIGHYALLERFGNRYIAGGAREIHDWLLAVYVLGHTYREALAGLEHGEHLSWARDMGAQFTSDTPLNWDECDAFLLNYINEQTAPPLFRAVPGNGRPVNAPFLATLKLFVCQHLGLNADEAMDYPYGLAWYEYAAWLDMEGVVTLSDTETEEEIQRVVREIARKHPDCAPPGVLEEVGGV